MNKKLILLCTLVILLVLSQYIMKNSIIRNTQENAILEKELMSERAINKELTSDYNHLQAYSRIVSIAMNDLDMIIPANDPNKVQVVHNNQVRNRTVSRFIDFVSPSAEAATF